MMEKIRAHQIKILIDGQRLQKVCFDLRFDTHTILLILRSLRQGS